MHFEFYYQPLEQFEIFHAGQHILFIKLLGPVYTLLLQIGLLTNFGLYIIFVIVMFYFFLHLGLMNQFLLPRAFNYIMLKLYTFITAIYTQTIDKGISQRFLPFFLYLFFFILFSNLLGFLPYSYTITSSVIVTFSLAFSYWLGITIFSIWKFGYKFFLFFIPHDLPLVLKPILTVLEIISYISRPFSLSIRLFANLLSGHTLLFILSNVVLKLQQISIIFAIFPVLIILLLNFLELGISFLQAYVFYTLLIIYFRECYTLGH